MLIGEDLEDHSTFGGVLSQAIDHLKGMVKKGVSSVFDPLPCSCTDVRSARQAYSAEVATKAWRVCGLAERSFLTPTMGPAVSSYG